MNKNCLAFAVVLLIFGACRKDIKQQAQPKPLEVEEIANTNDPSQPTIVLTTGITLQPTRPSLNFIFDWETATQMPTPSGQPAIPTPWSDQANRLYDPGLRYDYKKSDGWELLYNSFSDSIYAPPSIFILYNKYRGLLRYYAYNPLPVGASVADARWFRNEISFFASGSPLLNFAGQTIVDIEDNTKDVSLLDPWPLQQSGWYIAQFEMAYDKNATHLPVPQSRIDWPLSFVKVNEVLLNNANATEQPVSLQAEKVNFNDVWSVYNKLQGNFKLHVKSMSSLDRLHGVFSTEVINNLKQSASTNSYGNLLNATAIPAEDYLNCRLDVPGSVSWDPKEVLYASVHVATPGPDNSQVIGSGPVFNEPMGIFYLDAKPIIHYTRIKNSLPEEYKLDVSSVKYVVNPFVRSYAEISNFNQEIVAMDSAETKSLTEARIYHGKMLKASEPLNILGVRVSFDITPKNGSATIKMIKTFTATVQP